ncbi:MAG: AAA family ATPase [Clostridia bacterium]|nr:AAA family ATPase [Clostridia bacterium]
MQYLESFTFPRASAEEAYYLSYPPELEMACYGHETVYPFKVFPQKGFSHVTFAPITILCGSNGSGKSTALNVIAEKLSLTRAAPFNHTPFFREYLKLCDYRLTFRRRLPEGSRIITSDDVFDFLLDIRTINKGIAGRREALFDEYDAYRRERSEGRTFLLRSMEDYDELKYRNELKRTTKSAYTAKRLGTTELAGMSNGESAYRYFTTRITENALYLLDEPENSLSVKLQDELRQFIEEAVRFYHCQFIISTHSPFLLAARDAKVYDLDTTPVREVHWTEIENVRRYHDFFKRHKALFKE